MTSLQWKLGVEIELLAPRGASRRTLADALAAAHGGSARTFFHPQAEPSKVAGKPVFHNLTQGFEVLDAAGAPVARLVDDVTLQDDLRRAAPPVPGWVRIVGDDERLLRLVARYCDPDAPLDRLLDPVAALFGVSPLRTAGGVRLGDSTGAPIAIAAPLPGERERPAELITPPIERDHEARLEALLSVARDLGFTAPAEGAVHLHFDGAALCHAAAFARVVTALDAAREQLRAEFCTNPRCRRLGPWSPELLACVASPDFLSADWDQARALLAKAKLTKYNDFNLLNLVRGTPEKHTLEVRILPVHLHAEPIVRAAQRIEDILRAALQSGPLPR